MSQALTATESMPWAPCLFERTYVRELRLSPQYDRGKIRNLAASHALDMLRRRLTNLPVVK